MFWKKEIVADSSAGLFFPSNVSQDMFYTKRSGAEKYFPTPLPPDYLMVAPLNLDLLCVIEPCRQVMHQALFVAYVNT